MVKDKIAYLTARYDELEATAREARDAGPNYGGSYGDTAHAEVVSMASQEGCTEEAVGFVDHWTPEFVLADIASKRAVLALHEAELERELDKPAHRVAPDALGAWIMKKDIIDALLQPFAGRDDFPAEWRA